MDRSRNRPGVWRTGVVQIVCLLLYVAAAEALISATDPRLSGLPLTLVGIAMALIPAALWLSFFYVQDRLEPEPRHYVLGVAVLGALLAAAVGQPLLERVFDTSSWIGRDTLTELLGSILLTGFLQMFLIYAAVRYSTYYSTEFDQRVDGVLYGTASGLGYATMLNVRAVVESEGLNLSAGVIRVVVTALVYSALGGLLGYFIARTKFDDEPVWWMPAGLASAACITGLFSWVRGEITQRPISLSATGLGSAGYNPYPALVLGAALALALLVLVFYLIRRANRLTLAGADADQR